MSGYQENPACFPILSYTVSRSLYLISACLPPLYTPPPSPTTRTDRQNRPEGHKTTTHAEPLHRQHNSHTSGAE